MKQKIVFFGSSDFAAAILETLFSEFEIALVLTRPDKPVGRKAIPTASPVKQKARQLGLEFFAPDSLKNDQAISRIKAAAADLFVIVAYGKIIPQNILDIAVRGAVNVHPSLLPLCRGVWVAKHFGFGPVYWDFPSQNYYKTSEIIRNYLREAVALVVYMPKILHQP